uniref:THUMP domain-containing protein 2 isoform X1 n=1 Tax=Petromyzon marinus TaxID=7757 RepID=A0AAJ7SU06_PETMA|nr:THUMP domain-containing protein 2 isoform X1 [Petromyzon marinus]XP_032805541.1 THUMP domain-containing protein 2 isoform X1 [Petromyzon marinus]
MMAFRLKLPSILGTEFKNFICLAMLGGGRALQHKIDQIVSVQNLRITSELITQTTVYVWCIDVISNNHFLNAGSNHQGILEDNNCLMLKANAWLKCDTQESRMCVVCFCQPHAVVMDPMCGMGTLLLEAAMAWKTVRCLGTDVDAQQLAHAKENIHFAELDHRIGLLQASVTALPIPCSAIDVIICDIPFGQKYSSDEEMKHLMPKILQEMMRVLRVGGNIVLLVSSQMSSRIRSLSQELHKLCDKNTESSGESAAAASAAKTMVFQDTSDPQATSNEDEQRCVQARAESCVESEEVTCDSRLTCEGVYPVSLGETDACIHRYKKTATPT